MISRSEIMKMMCLIKEYSAAAGGKTLLHNPLKSVSLQKDPSATDD
jgi:hypothetical protein